MYWFSEMAWWQWVLLALANSFLGYWVGVGTLYCWHNLRLVEQLKPQPHEKNDIRKMAVAFLMWPGSTTDRLDGQSWWEPMSMDGFTPGQYLLGMILLGPVPKIMLTCFLYVLCLLVFLFRRVARNQGLFLPKFINVK